MFRIQTSIYGRIFGRTADDRVMCPKGFLSGDFGNQMPIPDMNSVVLFDDFVGATIDQAWATSHGTDGAAAAFAVNPAASGTVRGTTGATTTTMAGSGIIITGELNFKAQGAVAAAANNLEFNARVKVDVITNQVAFIGLTNAKTLQMPIQGSGAGNAFTANANDAVGFVFDTTMTNPAWWLIGAKGGVLATGQSSGLNPVAATYAQFAVSVDNNGNANFFYNGNQIGVTMPNAVTATVALTPVVAAFNRTAAAARNFDIDYLMTSMNRV